MLTEQRYQVLFEIAAGGMGRVAIARVRGTASFQRLVALKTIHPFLADDPRFQSMFFEEARLAAGIHHPNVVPVLDLGRQDGTFYLAMEYVPGEPLSTVLADCTRDGVSIPLGASLRWISDACAGLHAAHELRDPMGQALSLVHRDVSPSNLIVTEHGSCKLTDFGIAKALGTRDHTTVGALKGKIGYLSPEQVMGEKPDRRSDIFSLGAILFEVTTGRKLYGGTGSVETLEAISRADYPDPRSIVPDYPDDLADVLRAALTRDRRQRYATAEAMGAALERVSRTLPSPMVAADIGAWVRGQLGPRFDARRRKCADALRALDGDDAMAEPPTNPSARPIDARSLSGGLDVDLRRPSAPLAAPAPVEPRVTGTTPAPSRTDASLAPQEVSVESSITPAIVPAVAPIVPVAPVAASIADAPSVPDDAQKTLPSMKLAAVAPRVAPRPPPFHPPVPSVAPPPPPLAAMSTAPPSASTAPFPAAPSNSPTGNTHTPTPLTMERETTPVPGLEASPHGTGLFARKRVVVFAAAGVACALAIGVLAIRGRSANSGSTAPTAATAPAIAPVVHQNPAPNPSASTTAPQGATAGTTATTAGTMTPDANTPTTTASHARAHAAAPRARAVRRPATRRHRDGSYRPADP